MSVKKVRFGLIFLGALSTFSQVKEINWRRLSITRGELPVPGESREQTGVLAVRLDKNSAATDFVMSFRVVAPALVWFRRTPRGWDRYVIEKEFLPIEAGSAAYDIDGDGDHDIVFGNDSQGEQTLVVGKSVSELRPQGPLEAAFDQERGRDATP